MKLRYYLRGLGLGILLTSVLFLAGPKDKSMSDQEIKERAKELGMVESTVLTEIHTTEISTEDFQQESSSETVITTEESSVEEKTTESMEAATTTGSTENSSVEKTSSVETPSSQANSEETKNQNNKDENGKAGNGTDKIADSENEIQNTENSKLNPDSGQEELKPEKEAKEVIITVRSGDGSGTVAKYLQDAGIVEDAHEFDRFLMANGYDKKISAGQHTILTTASWDEIGKSLCNMR